eukprot:8535307-Karenia_brevis.AAC.1
MPELKPLRVCRNTEPKICLSSVTSAAGMNWPKSSGNSAERVDGRKSLLVSSRRVLSSPGAKPKDCNARAA